MNETSGGVRLLAGGNPQIAKGEGAAPVAAYLAAMPGWKRDVGEAIDALAVATVPGLRKAVRWNSPFYGAGRDGWFMSFHCFERYVKVTFFRGAALDPPPPVGSKHPQVRYAHLHEGERPDATFAAWMAQASRLPGEAV